MEESTLSKFEVWVEADELGELFEISSLGRLRSVDRILIFSDNKPNRLHKGRILKTNVDRYGYERVRVTIEKKKISKRIHRLVAQAFITNPKGKEQVNHINGDKQDNRVENLEWCTNQENQIHANKIGLRVSKTGKNSARYESSVEVLDMGGNYLYSLHGNKEMTERGFDFRLVSGVVHGKRKSHKGHKFRREHVKV